MAECSYSLIGLGWDASGFFIMVSHMVLCRAKLWSTPAANLHASDFRCSYVWPTSWADKSQALLEAYSILDFPNWTYQGGILDRG